MILEDKSIIIKPEEIINHLAQAFGGAAVHS